MARPKCMLDVWDVSYQEILVVMYGHEKQTTKAICEMVKPTALERVGKLDKYIIK